MQIPYYLKEKIKRVYGEKGRRWLTEFPSLLNECRERWSLELEKPFDNLSYNFVVPARTQQGLEVVLKLGVPCRELFTEAAALNLFEGAGAVRLLDADVLRGILLLERVLPGTPIFRLLEDAEATRAAAKLMRNLWREAPAAHSFQSLAIWFRAFERLRNESNKENNHFPVEIAARAERVFFELNASAERSVILHGDLHHENILYSAKSGWLVIDPKGIEGDCGYEIGAFMLNQLPVEASDSAIKEIFNRRLSIFSDELQISRNRLAEWAFCHAVLSAVWDFEEQADYSGTIRLAKILEGAETGA